MTKVGLSVADQVGSVEQAGSLNMVLVAKSIFTLGSHAFELRMSIVFDFASNINMRMSY